MRRFGFVFIIFLLLAVAVLMCCNRSGGSAPHSHSWELMEDGSWQCSTCGTVLESTIGAYMAVLSHGRPVEVTVIKGHDYTYENTSGKSRKVVIKTSGGNLTINAPKDTVWLFGHASSVNVVATKKVLHGD